MKTPASENEQHGFSRVPFVNQVTLSDIPYDTASEAKVTTKFDPPPPSINNSNHYRDWQGTVVDICFNGILINGRSLPNTPLNTTESSIASTIHFEGGINIHANLDLVHQHDDFYGFRFSEMDTDSLKHLKELVMSNLGDDACQREVMSLFSYHQ